VGTLNEAAVLGLILAVAGAGGPGAPRFGVVASEGGAACLAMAGPPVAAGEHVVVVTPDVPQRLFPAQVEEPVGAPGKGACAALQRALVDGPYYRIAGFPPRGGQPGPIAVAILGEAQVALSTAAGRLTYGRGNGPISLRSCSSREGIHLTAWAGTPLQGRRLWHAYWYLGYDVEPSCTKGDSAP
jgi:hypothetical protein